MNREIKFRYWDKKQFRMDNNVNYLGQVERLHEGIYMQFTGLLDKNKKEIYEGDIMKWKKWKNWEQEGTEHPDIYVIAYEAPTFIWHCYRDQKELDTDGSDGIRNTDEFEIIGNIYENPELLNSKSGK